MMFVYVDIGSGNKANFYIINSFVYTKVNINTDYAFYPCRFLHLNLSYFKLLLNMIESHFFHVDFSYN